MNYFSGDDLRVEDDGVFVEVTARSDGMKLTYLHMGGTDRYMLKLPDAPEKELKKVFGDLIPGKILEGDGANVKRSKERGNGYREIKKEEIPDPVSSKF